MRHELEIEVWPGLDLEPRFSAGHPCAGGRAQCFAPLPAQLDRNEALRQSEGEAFRLGRGRRLLFHGGAALAPDDGAADDDSNPTRSPASAAQRTLTSATRSDTLTGNILIEDNLIADSLINDLLTSNLLPRTGTIGATKSR
jgi:hypothetical protein